MKRKVLGSLILAGILGISGTAFADININLDLNSKTYKPITEVHNQHSNSEVARHNKKLRKLRKRKLPPKRIDKKIAEKHKYRKHLHRNPYRKLKRK